MSPLLVLSCRHVSVLAGQRNPWKGLGRLRSLAVSWRPGVLCFKTLLMGQCSKRAQPAFLPSAWQNIYHMSFCCAACAHHRPHRAGTCVAACSDTPAGACCRGQQGIPPAARHAASEVFSVLVEALLRDAEHGAADDEGRSRNCGPSASASQEICCSGQVAICKPPPGHSAQKAEIPNSVNEHTAECCICGTSATCHGLECAANKGGWASKLACSSTSVGRFDALACSPGTDTAAPTSSACSHRPARILLQAKGVSNAVLTPAQQCQQVDSSL